MPFLISLERKQNVFYRKHCDRTDTQWIGDTLNVIPRVLKMSLITLKIIQTNDAGKLFAYSDIS